MWIFLNNAYLSIVADRDNAQQLLVRARRPGDIHRVFPEAEVFETPSADYRYRAFIPRDRVVEAIAREVAAISYDNFKNSVEDNDRHDAYLRVWAAMSAYQRQGAAKQAPPTDQG